MLSQQGVSVAASILMPLPGQMVALSPAFRPPLLKAIKVYPNDPFKFDFVLDKGGFNEGGLQTRPYNPNGPNVAHDESRGGRATSLQRTSSIKDANRLIKYFLAALTIPENDLWVNLSPYEKDRIVPDAFGKTEMGRDLLAQDYILKQITASLMYPEGDVGKNFWSKVYAALQDKYGTTDIPVDTFNKVWIVPDKAEVYEHNQSAYVTQAHLKVMLETDYVAMQHDVVGALRATPLRSDSSHELTKNILRETIIPILEKEVNEGENFAQLRQVYYSLILATWYKRKIMNSLDDARKGAPWRARNGAGNPMQYYIDHNKTVGVDYPRDEAMPRLYNTPEQIWSQYVEAFKKGVYNYIEDVDGARHGVPLRNDMGTFEPRQYFSGGAGFDRMGDVGVFSVTQDFSQMPNNIHDGMMIRTHMMPMAEGNNVQKKVSTNRLIIDHAAVSANRFPGFETQLARLAQKMKEHLSDKEYLKRKVFPELEDLAIYDFQAVLDLVMKDIFPYASVSVIESLILLFRGFHWSSDYYQAMAVSFYIKALALHHESVQRLVLNIVLRKLVLQQGQLFTMPLLQAVTALLSSTDESVPSYAFNVLAWASVIPQIRVDVKAKALQIIEMVMIRDYKERFPGSQDAGTVVRNWLLTDGMVLPYLRKTSVVDYILSSKVSYSHLPVEEKTEFLVFRNSARNVSRIGLVDQDGSLLPKLPEFEVSYHGKFYVNENASVVAGKGSIAYSSGFARCHAVLIRNVDNGRYAFFHVADTLSSMSSQVPDINQQMALLGEGRKDAVYVTNSRGDAYNSERFLQREWNVSTSEYITVNETRITWSLLFRPKTNQLVIYTGQQAYVMDAFVGVPTMIDEKVETIKLGSLFDDAMAAVERLLINKYNFKEYSGYSNEVKQGVYINGMIRDHEKNDQSRWGRLDPEIIVLKSEKGMFIRLGDYAIADEALKDIIPAILHERIVFLTTIENQFKDVNWGLNYALPYLVQIYQARALFKDARVVEFGIGRGIGALLAIKLGAQQVVGIEKDWRIQNELFKEMALNGVSSKQIVFIEGGFSDKDTINKLMAYGGFSMGMGNIGPHVIYNDAPYQPKRSRFGRDGSNLEALGLFYNMQKRGLLTDQPHYIGSGFSEQFEGGINDGNYNPGGEIGFMRNHFSINGVRTVIYRKYLPATDNLYLYHSYLLALQPFLGVHGINYYKGYRGNILFEDFNMPLVDPKEADKGGIDLNPAQMEIGVQGPKDIKFNVDAAQIQQLKEAAGLTSLIFDVQPCNNLLQFMGV